MHPYFQSHFDKQGIKYPSKELIAWFNHFKTMNIPCVIIKTTIYELWRKGIEATPEHGIPNNTPLPKGKILMSYKFEKYLNVSHAKRKKHSD